MARVHLPRTAAAVLLVALAACNTTPREPDGSWVTAEVEAPSDRVVREIIVSALERERYPLGSGLDPVERVAVSGWYSTLSPFKGRGYRLQAEVRYGLPEEGVYPIEVRVKKQLNQELARPLEPASADWEWTDDDLLRAQVLLYHIQAAFEPEIGIPDPDADPIEEWEERYGGADE